MIWMMLHLKVELAVFFLAMEIDTIIQSGLKKGSSLVK